MNDFKLEEQMKRKKFLYSFLIALIVLCTACVNGNNLDQPIIENPILNEEIQKNEDLSFGDTGNSLDEFPEYSGNPYVSVNNNVPYFTEDEMTEHSFEIYSDLDQNGRCGVAYANIGLDLMPSEERGQIGQIKPSGWHTIKYDIVDGKYLYNRCHLIGYQLSGENANEKNLITGTRYLNIQGMLPFENMVADYVKETGNHVLYRVTPMYEGDNLVSKGVLMEAKSVEDDGAGILYNVFVYNVQPGIEINYATGESWELEGIKEKEDTNETLTLIEKENKEGSQLQEGKMEGYYVLNLNSKKVHRSDCESVETMKASNREDFYGTREEVVLQGYIPCGSCKP